MNSGDARMADDFLYLDTRMSFFSTQVFLSAICDPSSSNFVRNFDLENVTFVCYWFATGIFLCNIGWILGTKSVRIFFYTCNCSHKIKLSRTSKKCH